MIESKKLKTMLNFTDVIRGLTSLEQADIFVTMGWCAFASYCREKKERSEPLTDKEKITMEALDSLYAVMECQKI